VHLHIHSCAASKEQLLSTAHVYVVGLVALCPMSLSLAPQTGDVSLVYYRYSMLLFWTPLRSGMPHRQSM
jgi:hypothetical protein